MKIILIILSLFALCIGMVYASGCGGSGIFQKEHTQQDTVKDKPTPGSVLRDLGSAPAGLAVVEGTRPFLTAGLALAIVGGVMFAFGGRGTGLSLMGVGAIISASGVLFIQYPWVVLVAAILASLPLMASAYSGWRTRRELATKAAELTDADNALEVLAEQIETKNGGEEIKAGIKSLGPEAAKRVRKVIAPIKDKLTQAGKIKTI